MTAAEMFTTDITLRAAFVTLAAIGVMILVSNNRPARTRLFLPVTMRRPAGPVRVERLPVQIYRSPRWWERVVSATGLAVVAAVAGAVIATIVAGTLIYGVTTLTGLLK